MICKVIKLIFILISFTHIVACLWFIISTIDYDEENSWVLKTKIYNFIRLIDFILKVNQNWNNI